MSSCSRPSPAWPPSRWNGPARRRTGTARGAGRSGTHRAGSARRCHPAAVRHGHAAAGLLAVLREALSNVARHANATAVRVSVHAGSAVSLRVEDNGVGIAPGAARGGLLNMAERAHDLGGSFSAGPGPDGGTVL